MKAEEISIVQFFQQPKQLIAFAPQRVYRWTESECKQLWDDILRISKDDSVSGYCIGTVLYEEYDVSGAHGLQRYILIDGHQRLTAISLLIAALRETLREKKDPRCGRYRDMCDTMLFNAHGKGELDYKLVLAPEDNELFTRIIEGEELSLRNCSPLLTGYNYFVKQLKKTEMDPELVYKGISKLTIIDILSDRKYVNPRLIHEKIHSTGLDATQTGLIRKWLSLLEKAASL